MPPPSTVMRLARGRTRWFPGGCYVVHVGGGGGAAHGPRGEGAWAGEAPGGFPQAPQPRSLQSAAPGRLTVTRAARVCFLFPQARLQQRESSAAGVPSLDPREPLVRSFTPRHADTGALVPRRLLSLPRPRPPPATGPCLLGVCCVRMRGVVGRREGSPRTRAPGRSGVSRESSGETAEPAGSRTGPLGTKSQREGGARSRTMRAWCACVESVCAGTPPERYPLPTAPRVKYKLCRTLQKAHACVSPCPMGREQV
jgi:hypothetical protein